MSIKFIHTGDLHIGQRLKKNTRAQEHKNMLSWIHNQIEETQAELLLISGDVFDTSSPNPDSMRIFNSFLADLESLSSLQTVIITAGNHDSARRLDSLKPVLKRLGIHIVGAFQNDNPQWDDWLIPVYNPSGDVQAAVAAIPFVHEYRLGITRGTRATYAQEIKNGFKSLYARFARMAQEKYPGVPHIAMGHLTAMNEAEVVGSAPQNVHVAVENGMDGDIFGTSYDYVALGHIHKNYRVRGMANAYYCGSPLPCSIAEAEDSMNRGVWFLDLDQSKKPRLLEIPVQRQFLRWRGTLEEITKKVATYSWSEDQEPPFVWLCVETDHPRYDLWEVCTEIIMSRDVGQRLILIDVDNVVEGLEPKKDYVVDVTTTPHEIFEELLAHKGITITPQLRGLFDLVLTQVEKDKEEV